MDCERVARTNTLCQRLLGRAVRYLVRTGAAMLVCSGFERGFLVLGV
jgi:hypothetical protein